MPTQVRTWLVPQRRRGALLLGAWAYAYAGALASIGLLLFKTQFTQRVSCMSLYQPIRAKQLDLVVFIRG